MKPILLASLPHQRWACDLDGVLAVKPPLSSKKWTNMNGAERAAYRDATLEWYRIAEQLGVPDIRPTIILSARKETPEIRAITQVWLDSVGLDRIPLRLLNTGRTTENAAAFKRDMVHKYDCQALVEDNMSVLKAMKRLSPACSLYFWDKDSADIPDLIYHSIL